MKKIFRYGVLFLCVLFMCVFLTSCNSIPKEDYDKLNDEYDALLEEKQELEKVSNWLELYRSIDLGKTFDEISAMCKDYPMVNHGWGQGFLDDGSAYRMDVFAWENRDSFDMYHTKENQIVIVFLDGVAIFKEYGWQNCILDNGTVRFPAHKVPIVE